MSSAYYSNHDYQTDAIIFGGNIQRKSKFDKHVVTEMRKLKFGELTLNYIILLHSQNIWWEESLVSKQCFTKLKSTKTNCLLYTNLSNKFIKHFSHQTPIMSNFPKFTPPNFPTIQYLLMKMCAYNINTLVWLLVDH